MLGGWLTWKSFGTVHPPFPRQSPGTVQWAVVAGDTTASPANHLHSMNWSPNLFFFCVYSVAASFFLFAHCCVHGPVATHPACKQRPQTRFLRAALIFFLLQNSWNGSLPTAFLSTDTKKPDQRVIYSFVVKNK